MIVVCVLLKSAVDGKVTELARANICNIGGTEKVRDYEIKTLRGRKTEDFAAGKVTHTGRITGHRSLDLHVWHLVSKALQAVGYGSK